MSSPASALFKEQLNHFLLALATERQILDPVSNAPSPNFALPFWYLETFHGYTEEQTASLVTDDFGDLQIDAIVISDDEDSVNFYQCKNPVDIHKGIAGGDIDKLISGITLILEKQHGKIANRKINERVLEIRKRPRRFYNIIFISTGEGLPPDGIAKLNALVERWEIKGTSPLKYQCFDISAIQEMYYTKTLPTLDKEVVIKANQQPYAIKIGHHRCFLFHMNGKDVAGLYKQHGEQILQQNIRPFEGINETNKAIFRTATAEHGDDFFYYNNGITILADNCEFDQFQNVLTAIRPQIVNGGQTVRVLTEAFDEGKLNANVNVVVRIITSDKDKSFAGDVAVNLNNQTIVKPAFIRSNHPEIIQLQSTLLTKGWYLERRDGDCDVMPGEDIEAIEHTIRGKLSERLIKLYPACQAYIAFFDRNIEISKKSPRSIFLPMEAGGYFEKFISSNITADKFILSWELYNQCLNLKHLITRVKRADKKDKLLIISDLFKRIRRRIPKYDLSELEELAPQAPLFLLAICGYRYLSLNTIDIVQKHQDELVADLPFILFKLSLLHRDTTSSWQTLLKSQAFFDRVLTEYKREKYKK
jgi:hypothetical protein